MIAEGPEEFGECNRRVDETLGPTGLFFVGTQKFGLKEVGLQTAVESLPVYAVPLGRPYGPVARRL